MKEINYERYQMLLKKEDITLEEEVELLEYMNISAENLESVMKKISEIKSRRETVPQTKESN
jgi:hypothetical protein